ncbi:MAG: hypothetical protein U0326_00900 [Polyangiales bacterium]
MSAQAQPSFAEPLQSRSTPSQRSRVPGSTSPVHVPHAEPVAVMVQVCEPARHAPTPDVPMGPE